MNPVYLPENSMGKCSTVGDLLQLLLRLPLGTTVRTETGTGGEGYGGDVYEWTYQDGHLTLWWR